VELNIKQRKEDGGFRRGRAVLPRGKGLKGVVGFGRRIFTIATEVAHLAEV